MSQRDQDPNNSAPATARSGLSCDAVAAPGTRFTRRGGAAYLLAAALGATGLAVTAKKAHAGYFACSQCKCPGYQGNSDICDNCGHNYRAHW